MVGSGVAEGKAAEHEEKGNREAKVALYEGQPVRWGNLQMS